MVLTKPELIALLQNEVRILRHLVTKIDRSKLDYRPTPKQRSIVELIRYLSMMGPEIVRQIKAGASDVAAWNAAEEASRKVEFDQALTAIAGHGDYYAKALGDLSDADLRAEVDMFGDKGSRGYHLVTLVLSGCTAYRTQLFLYLKACGRTELSSSNLWGGVDEPAAV